MRLRWNRSDSPCPLIFAKLCLSFFLLALLMTVPNAVAQTDPPSSNTASIESALRTRNFEQALQLLAPQLSQSPDNARLWIYKGIALAGLGRAPDAIEAYNKALKISPDNLAALEGAAELEYKAGSYRAVPLLNHILKLRPNDATTHAMLAVLSYNHHDCAEAAKHFRESSQLISSQPVALAQFGSCLMDQQQPNEALPIFEKILALSPGEAHARYNLAVVELAAQHSKDAVETLQPLLGTQPPDPDVLDLASAAYEDSGDTPRAVELLRQAIIANPQKIRYYLDFATLSFKHESFQVGVDVLNAGLAQLPKAAPLYIARGILYIQMGSYEKGQSDFEAANKLDPGQASASVAQGLALLQQSNLDQALETVRSQLKAHPQDAFLNYLKSEIITQKGATAGSPEFAEALAAASRAVQLRPDFSIARNSLANLYLKSGQGDLAAEQSRLVLRDNPSDQVAVYHLLLALRKGKDSKGEIPGLVKKLADLREEAKRKESSEINYKLYEPNSSPSTTNGPKP